LPGFQRFPLKPTGEVISGPAEAPLEKLRRGVR